MKIFRGILSLIAGAIVFSLVSGCFGKSEQYGKSDTAKTLQVKLDVTNPSYKDLFDHIDVILLESNSQCMIGYLDKTICIGDSILTLDMSRSTILLFSPDGNFLNSIGKRGDGPEDYLMCYDVAYNINSHSISVLEPRGTLNEYETNGRYISTQKLPSKPNYMACEWLADGNLALWSAVNDDEYGVTVINKISGKIVFEDWKRDRMLDMQCLHPFYRFNEEVKFCPSLTNDVYVLSDSCLHLDYTWNFIPENISDDYLNRH